MERYERPERSAGRRTAAGTRAGTLASRTAAGRTSAGRASASGAAAGRTPAGRTSVNKMPAGRTPASRTSSSGSGVRTGAGSRQGRSGSDQMRARAAAKRRRRRRRQQKMILAVLVLFIAAAAVGGVLGIRSLKRNKDQKALRAEAMTSMESGDYSAAIEKFDQALEMSGKRIGKFEIDVLQQRAEAEYRLGDYAAALHTWQLLTDKDGAKDAYKEGAVLCMIETGDYEEALKQGVLESRIYNKMALDQINRGEYDQALETIAKGMESSDTSGKADLAYNQAVAYENKGDFAKALELFEAYTAQYGADPNVEREITFLKTRQGNNADQQETE